MSVHARQFRAAPYIADHDASIAVIARKGQRPKGFGPLLTWFSEVWAAELPERLHARGVWRDRLSKREADDGAQPVGGSLLGSGAVGTAGAAGQKSAPRTGTPTEAQAGAQHRTRKLV